MKILTRLALLFIFALGIKVSTLLAATPAIEVIHYGTSLGGEKLTAIKLFDADVEVKHRYGVMITGGLHGNEYMGLVGKFPKLFAQLETVQKFLGQGGVVYFVPMINPDGVKNRGRTNSEGLDLNRTFLSEYLSGKRESSELSDWFEGQARDENVKLLLSMDYHCCKGSLIYPQITEQTWQSKREFYQSIFNKTATHMKTELDTEYVSGVTKDIFGYETRGTLKDYWFQKYGTVSFTFEGSSPDKEIKKLSGHIKWWNKIFAELGALPDQSIAMLAPEWQPTEAVGTTAPTAQSE